MAAYVSKLREVLVYLEDPVMRGPQTAVDFDQVTVTFKAPGRGVLPFALTAETWQEHGDGYYSMLFPGTLLNAPGEFHWWLTAPDAEYVYGLFEIDALPIEASIPPGQCLVSGSIVSLGGLPKLGALVSLRVIKTPTTVAGSLLDGNILQTYTTATGHFSLAVVQGVTAILEIASAAIRQQVVVPYTGSVDVLTLLPPIAS